MLTSTGTTDQYESELVITSNWTDRSRTIGIRNFGIFLPSLPYVIFMTVVVGWILAVLQSLIAAPLWAVMHMTPDRTFVGSQSQGYLLLLSLFARPALAVVGLFAAMLVSDPIIDFIAKGFFAMRGAVVTST